MGFSKSYCKDNRELGISGTNFSKLGQGGRDSTCIPYVKRPCDAYIAISQVGRNDIHSITRTLVCLGVFTSMDMDMQHGQVNAVYPSSCSCCISMSMRHVHVNAACSCSCDMSMWMLYICPCQFCVSISMLHVQVLAACACQCRMFKFVQQWHRHFACPRRCCMSKFVQHWHAAWMWT
jgi:hypothetical protein